MPETAANTVHLLLLDDHTLFRESASRLLAAESGIRGGCSLRHNWRGSANSAAQSD